jgi:hypothetical protein
MDITLVADDDACKVLEELKEIFDVDNYGQAIIESLKIITFLLRERKEGATITITKSSEIKELFYKIKCNSR